jgi:hypothetical protein
VKKFITSKEGHDLKERLKIAVEIYSVKKNHKKN